MRRVVCSLFLVLSGCSPFTIETDYDTTIDFSRFQTWNWYSGSRPPGLVLDGLTEQRIRAALEAELPPCGLTKAPEGAGDFQIAYTLSVNQRMFSLVNWRRRRL